MAKDEVRRLRRIKRALDKNLTVLDNLRCKTEKEEKTVLGLIKEQRLLQEKLHIEDEAYTQSA